MILEELYINHCKLYGVSYHILKYEKLKHKHHDKSDEWWFDTHGIDLKLL